ncbi:MAG: methyltransferase [Planctomycetes bacterium]|nr:methyltransferase [Planctomycetota bacterium]
MSPREIVRRTLAFADPPRIPRQLWLLPWAEEQHPAAVAEIRRRFPDDIVSAPGCYRTPPPCQGERHGVGRYVDEWGCVFENRRRGVIGEVKEPLVPDWGRVGAVHVPVERLSVDVERVNDFCRATDRFIIAGAFPRPFEQLQFIRGTENLLIDLAEEPPALFDLLRRMHAFYLEELEVWARSDVDALMIMDDWGGQQAMLVSPDLWRRIFKPLYRDYIEVAHARGKKVFMHSDGYILDILPDLVDLGLDAINCQVFCMDVDLLGARFGGRITFWGEMDRQHVLPRGSRAEVLAAAARLRRAFHRQGGLIAQCEFGVGADPCNVAAFFEALAGG